MREAIRNHQEPKQEPRQQLRKKRLRISELQQFGLPEEGQSRVPSAWLPLRGRERPSPSSLQFLQVPSAVAETLVSLCRQSTGPNTCFLWHQGCTKIIQVALVVFLPLVERIWNSLFSPFSTKKSLLSGQELAWTIFQLGFPASLSVH